MKKKKLPVWASLILVALYLLFGLGNDVPEAAEPVIPTESITAQAPERTEAPALDEDGSYTSKEDVALYIHIYGHLPGNFMTKKEAQKLGWEGGSLEKFAPGMCIGGDKFGNYEGLLPEPKGISAESNS